MTQRDRSTRCQRAVKSRQVKVEGLCAEGVLVLELNRECGVLEYIVMRHSNFRFAWIEAPKLRQACNVLFYVYMPMLLCDCQSFIKESFLLMSAFS